MKIYLVSAETHERYRVEVNYLLEHGIVKSASQCRYIPWERDRRGMLLRGGACKYQAEQLVGVFTRAEKRYLIGGAL